MFYLALGLQIIGMIFVTICLYAGIVKGNYGQFELIQFVGGMILFYGGTLIKGKFSK